MIELTDVHKSYRARHGRVDVLRGVNMRVERGQKIGVFGLNGAGKSTLVRLIGGVELPTRGKINQTMSVSWPLAFGGAFQNSLTGKDNLRFICRVYGVDLGSRLDYVQEFAELGSFMNEPVRTYSAGMRARLAFAISMAVDFDCFLIDEVMAVGDSRFQERCEIELFENRKDRAMVFVSHYAESILRHCSSAYVLEHGILSYFDDVQQAYEHYSGIRAQAA
jgi:capsular polysaccharide transport system ATP-binding protein